MPWQELSPVIRQNPATAVRTYCAVSRYAWSQMAPIFHVPLGISNIGRYFHFVAPQISFISASSAARYAASSSVSSSMAGDYRSSYRPSRPADKPA
jgi:hypothetical protein